MKILLIFILFVFCVPLVVLAQSKKAVPPVSILLIEYNAPTLSISVDDKKMKVTEKNDTYANPVSSIPSSSTFVDKEYTLENEEFEDLIKIVKKSRFLYLGEEYGAPEAERHYPYKLKVKLLKKQKEVLYRSNPTYPPAPTAYTDVVAAITHLKKRKENKESSNPAGSP